jgi:hypothetical protein
MFFVITSNEDAFGPYATEEDAYFFASTNLEAGTWTITKTP